MIPNIAAAGILDLIWAASRDVYSLETWSLHMAKLGCVDISVVYIDYMLINDLQDIEEKVYCLVHLMWAAFENPPPRDLTRKHEVMASAWRENAGWEKAFFLFTSARNCHDIQTSTVSGDLCNRHIRCFAHLHCLETELRQSSHSDSSVRRSIVVSC